ncbi:MAG TPA: abscisic acid-deficient protein Aba4 family protein [Pyrinomonadaceae bacterium]|jgi:hypothetical protein
MDASTPWWYIPTPTNGPQWWYLISFIVTGIAYLTLIIFPRQSWANFWFAGLIVPLLLSILYTFALFIGFFTPPRSNPFDFFSLPGLRHLFEKDLLLLAGFLDLLIMPLLVAAWMARKAAQVRMPYVYLLICMVVTFGAPGTGFVLFALFAGLGGRWSQIARFDGQPPYNAAPVFARPGD